MKESLQRRFSGDKAVDILEVFTDGKGLDTSSACDVFGLRHTMCVEIYGEERVFQSSIEHPDEFISI